MFFMYVCSSVYYEFFCVMLFYSVCVFSTSVYSNVHCLYLTCHFFPFACLWCTGMFFYYCNKFEVWCPYLPPTSLKSGVFPFELELAKAVPNCKAVDSSVINKYRPM